MHFTHLTLQVALYIWHFTHCTYIALYKLHFTHHTLYIALYNILHISLFQKVFILQIKIRLQANRQRCKVTSSLPELLVADKKGRAVHSIFQMGLGVYR